MFKRIGIRELSLIVAIALILVVFGQTVWPKPIWSFNASTATPTPNLAATATISTLATALAGPTGTAIAVATRAARVEAFDNATGLHITLVAVTAGGGKIDFRYQIVDPEKAAATLAAVKVGEVRSDITDEVLLVSKLQARQEKTLKKGRVYYEILGNPRGVLKPGYRVSVVVGDARLDHVVVQ